jgi:uncharacterized protein YfaP (DUF2135 family)
LTINLSAASSQTVTVPISLSGTATQGAAADYTVSSSSIIVPPGAVTASLVITTIDDTIVEPSESVIVTLGAPTNAMLGTATVSTLTIIDNDVAPPTTGAITGRVINANSGAPLAGIRVSSGTASTTTTADGSYNLTGLTPASSVILNFSGAAFAPQSRTTLDFSSVPPANDVTVDVPMVPIRFTETFDPTAARTSTVPGSSAQVQLPANALRTATGGMPVGMVTVRITPIAPSVNPDTMPGNYMVALAGGGVGPFESFGAMDVTYTDSTGAALNLASGMLAMLQIPVSSRIATPPATMPLFFFDEVAGIWREERTATLMGTSPNQYYQGQVPHFSYWNADQRYNTISITGCVQDSAGVRVANASVSTQGTNYNGTASTRSTAQGNFTVAARINSTLVLSAARARIPSNQRMVTTTAANLNLPECLVLGQIGQSLSVRLSWGENPRDLDSHTLGPNQNNEIAYFSQGSLTAAPFVSLDVDDTTGFGPEFTTFTRFARNRRYVYFVQNFSGTFSPGQTGSPAQVQVQNSGNTTFFNPPPGETSATRFWHVFNITTDANCIPTLVPVQQFLASAPTNPNTDNTSQFCN